MKSAWLIAAVNSAFAVACSEATPKADAPPPAARERFAN
jgi:hypothetical protein